METLKLTYSKAVAGQRVVHGLQGGGPGMRDETGRPRYVAGKTWCGVERRARLVLVETNAAVTCQRCLARMWKGMPND